MISENCCPFIVFKHKMVQTIIGMLTEDKDMEKLWNYIQVYTKKLTEIREYI